MNTTPSRRKLAAIERQRTREQWKQCWAECDARLGFDFLAGAIERLGGITEAAKRLNKEPRLVERWLANGVGEFRAGDILDLVEASGFPMIFSVRDRFGG